MPARLRERGAGARLEAAARLRAVREQDDRAARRVLRRRLRAARRPSAGRAASRPPGRRRSPCPPRAEVEDRLPHVLALVGRRRDDGRRRVELHEPDLVRLRQLVEERAFIAATAASRRVGSTSFARIEPDTSTSRTTVASSTCAFSIACGRASAPAARVEREQEQRDGDPRPPVPVLLEHRPEHLHVREGDGAACDGRRRIAIANASTAGTASSATSATGEPNDTRSSVGRAPAPFQGQSGEPRLMRSGGQ